MAAAGRLSFSLVHTAVLLAIVLLPEFLRAVPVVQQEEAEVSASVSSDVESLETLVRNRRNVPVFPVPQFKRLPDFWGWYKFFMDTHNQEGVEDLDRLYLAHLQNKHKAAEGANYLSHLSAIYTTCANSDDPECISESSSKPKAVMVMPDPIKSAAVRMCNPYLDPYCLFPMLPKALAPAPPPAPEPAPVKLPAPIFTPLLPMPMKSHSGFYYYAPVLEPFLSAEQKTELLRICNPKDVECLQYHLRAAYGYRPAPGPVPSYSALNCDPKDPYCKPILVQKATSGFYHLLYPNCNPEVDPLCVSTVAAPAPLSAEEPPIEQQCNPLFDEGCNPLTATKLSGLTKPVLQYAPKDEPAPAPEPAAAFAPASLGCDPRADPWCILAVAHALRKPPPQLPEHQVRSRLGVAGKTKDGHDCYVHYDKDCTPVKASAKAKAVAAPEAAPEAPAKAPAAPLCHPYDPHCGRLAQSADVEEPRSGFILPDPHCDPEYDYNCRLRRADPALADEAVEPVAEEEEEEAAVADAPVQEAPAPFLASPRFEDFLRGYLSQYRKK